MENLLEQIKSIVYECGNIILNANLNKLDIEAKEGIGNIVTKYDKEIQDKLKNELLKLIPNSKFIGEEGKKDNILDDEYTFIVDPIDGTTNFSRDLHFSCIAVALLKNKEAVLSVVYNPYLNELFSAIKDKGAYLNNKFISVSNRKLEDGLLLYGIPAYSPDLRENALSKLNKLSNVASDIRDLGSAALEICYVACGRAEVYFHREIQPWDYAASSLILKEAGGIIKTGEHSDIKFDGPSSIIAVNNFENFNTIKKSIQ